LTGQTPKHSGSPFNSLEIVIEGDPFTPECWKWAFPDAVITPVCKTQKALVGSLFWEGARPYDGCDGFAVVEKDRIR
jgi:hypothetical protein